jgi:hypothetical protein
MNNGPDIFAAFRARVLRQSQEALRQYRDELRAVAQELAARGLHNSGGHLRRRVEVFRIWTQLVTDQFFDDVGRLPGDQRMHAVVHASFLSEQLDGFFKQAVADIMAFDAGPAAVAEVKRLTAEISEGMAHDLRDFQAGIWRPRSQGEASSVTNNTFNNYGSNSGPVQQGGEGAIQSATIHFDAQSVTRALEDFVIALKDPRLPDSVRDAAMIEVDTIRPQLRKPTPSVAIVREGLHTLRNIAEGVASNLLSIKIAAMMAAAGTPLT